MLSEDELIENRENMWGELLSREMDGPYYRERSADLAQVNVPLLSAANWGGQGLHTRGNFEASRALRRRTSGWRCTAGRTGRRSIRITASRCRRSSSATS